MRTVSVRFSETVELKTLKRANIYQALRAANFPAMNEPALYARANGPQRRDVNYFSDEFGEEIGKMSGRCLDVGSGPGDVAFDFILPKLNEKASLVCSDISEEMVNFGKEKYKDNERMSFIQLNIESPPEDLAEQFDHITSFYCLHWCQDLHQAFKNINNLLRPGGSTFLTFLAYCPGMDCYKTLESMPCYQPYIENADRYVPLYQHSLEPRESLKGLIEDVGFQVQHCSVREKSFTFVTSDAFSKFILATNPFMDFIPANVMKNYKNDLLNEYAKGCTILNENDRNKDEYSVLMPYGTFVLYLKKPLGNNM